MTVDLSKLEEMLDEAISTTTSEEWLKITSNLKKKMLLKNKQQEIVKNELKQLINKHENN